MSEPTIPPHEPTDEDIQIAAGELLDAARKYQALLALRHPGRSATNIYVETKEGELVTYTSDPAATEAFRVIRDSARPAPPNE